MLARKIADKPAVPLPGRSVSFGLALVTIGLAAVLVRGIGLGAQSYWIDEAVTLQIAAAPGPGALLAYVLWYDNHPPLYHLLLQAWLSLGRDEGTTRALSAILGVGAVPAVYWLGRTMVGRHTGLLAALLLALSPSHVVYSQELRMYTLVALLALPVVGAYWRWLASGSRAALLTFVVCATLTLYVEYLAGLVLVALAAHFLLVGRRTSSTRLWLGSQFAIFALAIPAIAIFAYQAIKFTGQFWAPPVRPEVLLATLQFFSVGYTLPPLLLPAAALFALPVALGLAQIRVRPTAVLLLALWAFLPMLGLYAVSALREPVYVERALIVSLPAFLLLAGAGLAQIGNRMLLVLLLGGLTLLSLVSLVSYQTDPLHGKPAIRAAAAYVTSVAGPRDLVLHPSGTYDSFQVYHQLLSSAAAPEYWLVDTALYREWKETTARWSAVDSVPTEGVKALLMRQTPLGGWGRAANAYRQNTLKTEIIDPPGLAALLPAVDRAVVVQYADTARRQFGQRLFLTRDNWRYPWAIDLDAAAMLPGFELRETQRFSGIDVYTYTRRQ